MSSQKKEAQSRHRARELAVQFLYSLGNRRIRDVDSAWDLFLGEGSFVEEESPAVKEYSRFLGLGAWRCRGEADDILLRVVTGWRPERMVAVDRAVLRLALFEGFLERSVPFAVAIAEAVDIAQAFGTEDSGRFVNGVLARVVRHLIPEAERVGKDAGKSRERSGDDSKDQSGPVDRR